MSQAQVLSPPFPVTVTGSAEVSDVGDLYFDGNGNSTYDPGEEDLEDLFRVTTSAAGLRLALDGHTSDCDLYLIDAGGSTVLAQSTNTGTTPEEIDMPALAAGTYLIAVSIFDPDPAGASTSPYMLTVEGSGGGANTAPTVLHTPPSAPATAGQPLTISATITDNASVASATLRYFEGGSSSATDVPMTASGGGATYAASIPASDVTAGGLRYQIIAQDNEGASTTRPDPGSFFSARVRAEQGLDRAVAASGTSASSYRLVSIPLDLDNPSPAAVLEDDLGEYDPDAWRFFGLRADQSYAEFPSAGSMTPGRAFWLAVSASGESFGTGAGTSVTLAQPFDVPLNAGWTFVATPFAFAVQRDFVRLNSGGTPDVRAFTGSWNTYSGSFHPFEGYAVASQGGDVLHLFPNFDPVPMRAGARSAKTGGVLSVQSASVASGSSEAASVAWAVQIVAEAGAVRDTDNLAVVSGGASDGLDALDRPEPPVIGDYVQVAFPHPDWESVFPQYSTDARPEPAQTTATWAFTVKTSVRVGCS